METESGQQEGGKSRGLSSVVGRWRRCEILSIKSYQSINGPLPQSPSPGTGTTTPSSGFCFVQIGPWLLFLARARTSSPGFLNSFTHPHCRVFYPSQTPAPHHLMVSQVYSPSIPASYHLRFKEPQIEQACQRRNESGSERWKSPASHLLILLITWLTRCLA